jgi:DNA-binding transcriptional regulator PaaX
MKPWIRLPIDLLQRKGIKMSAAIILSAIIDRCTDTTTGTATIAQSYLAKETGCTTRTVRNAIAELEALGLIEHKRTGRASVYRLTGCADLLPPKQRTNNANNTSTTNIPHTTWKRKKKEELSDEVKAELQDYLSLSNCFDDIEKT